jgi:hypothetical protein
MRILILAITLGLTLNANAENSIAKKDSIHFIDGVLIMANISPTSGKLGFSTNDTISLDEFIFLAKRRYERATYYSENVHATVRYLKQAKSMIAAEEKPELAKAGGNNAVAALVLGGALGYGLLITGQSQIDNAAARSSTFPLIPSWGEIFGGLSQVSGAVLAIVGLGAATIVAAQSANTPTMSSAHHKLEANDYIDKAVNSYNKIE